MKKLNLNFVFASECVERKATLSAPHPREATRHRAIASSSFSAEWLSVAAEDESSVGAEDEQEDIIREASTGPGLEAGQVDPT